MSQITVISGPERRRVWTDQQKRELAAAVSAPGANVAEIARRADLRREVRSPHPCARRCG
jgi:transposase